MPEMKIKRNATKNCRRKVGERVIQNTSVRTIDIRSLPNVRNAQPFDKQMETR